jgi:hypothetical protein
MTYSDCPNLQTNPINITPKISKCTAKPSTWHTQNIQINHSVALESTPVFNGVRDAQSWFFCVMFCRSLFVLFLSVIIFFVLWFTVSDYPFGIFWLPLWYLRFTVSDYPFGILDLQYLITPLVSSNLSFSIKPNPVDNTPKM